MRIHDRIEVFGLPDQHFTSNNGLKTIFRNAVARENSFAGKAKRYNLAAARIVRLELGQNPGSDEHDLVAWNSGFAERPSRFDLHGPVRHVCKQIGLLGRKARRDQSLLKRNARSGRLRPASRHCNNLPAAGRWPHARAGN